MEAPNTYFYASLRFVESDEGVERTEWHPTERFGPFSTLTRGAFATEQEVHDWCAQKRIHPSTYKVKTGRA